MKKLLNKTPLVALDIDGVLVRGGKVLENTRNALLKLQGQNQYKQKIPFVLLTNGGGILESQKAKELSERIKVNIQDSQVILSHSPMKQLTSKYGNGLSLIIGGIDCKHVALNYGFKKPVLVEEVQATLPSIWPFSKSKLEPVNYDFTKERFESILVFHDSHDWGRDAQLVCELLTSNNGLLGTNVNATKTPSIPIFFSNSDMVYSNDYKLPRFGAGAFKKTVQQLYHELTGQLLTLPEQYGKPFPMTYQYASQILKENQSRDQIEFYAVGDNIASDIVGANLHGWHSILVKTGVYKEGLNDHLYGKQKAKAFYLPPEIYQHKTDEEMEQLLTPKSVVEDIGEAVDLILSRHQEMN